MSRIIRSFFLPALLALLPCALLQAESAPEYAGIDHAGFQVSDLDKSLAFYTRLFGGAIWKQRNGERRYLKLGNSYLVLEKSASSGVEHTCLGINDFDLDLLHHYIEMQGIKWQDNPGGRDLQVTDRDGIRSQLAPWQGWDYLSSNTASIETAANRSAAIFQPHLIDEIYITVTNMEVDSLFYSRLLGKTGTLQAGSLWFTVGSARLRLSQAPVGQVPGINYVSILVSNTDLDAAAEQVFAAGGLIETILPNGFSFWDPDGLRIVVRTVGMF